MIDLDYLEYAYSQEQYDKELVQKNALAAKVFQFVFKDLLNDLVFVKQTGIVSKRWTLCYFTSYRECQKFYAVGKKFPTFCMFMEFTDDEFYRIGQYFPESYSWKSFNGSCNGFSYKEFPLKTMIESAIGKTILHLLEKPFGDLCIYMYNELVNTKQLLFKASNTEELLLQMDLGANASF